MPHNIQIAMWPQITVTSLHPCTIADVCCAESADNFAVLKQWLLTKRQRSQVHFYNMRYIIIHHLWMKITFGGCCPLTEFCPVQYSLYVQVLRSPILAALLHGTTAAGVSQTLRHCTRNGITELSQRAPPIFDRPAITLGNNPHSTFLYFGQTYLRNIWPNHSGPCTT